VPALGLISGGLAVLEGIETAQANGWDAASTLQV
jgi:hypothetical protein